MLFKNFFLSLAKCGTERNSITIHPLVHAWTCEWLDGQHQTTLARESIHLLGAKLVDPIHERDKFQENILHHSAACVENAITHGALTPLFFRWKHLPYLSLWSARIINFVIFQLYHSSDHFFIQLLDAIAQVCDEHYHQCAEDLR